MDLDAAVSTVALVSVTTRGFSLSPVSPESPVSPVSVGDPPHQAGAD
ncbi:hypothetical protein I545_4886 [Mycobacterium kansasii 662]|uniref:Uncharacterized protein n=2 Tax=Mycobacterium kansasii TaxID=1768 RepID=A0A1V3WWZ2_MYCKA|nr:hypothetical protein I547_2356 [Mycobacterium kansasii 824]EUA13459.1 hypothetical protein I545_4886 [Mycobacterium kansasii 662]KEP44753.1 hypothetical protein MKSMC1_02140 [Mycobacterium kansasii]OOK71479.1 hypothetical protein BZL29_5872 [Mycobacterium kansasii]